MPCVRFISIIVLLVSTVTFGKPPARIPAKPLNQKDPSSYAVPGDHISVNGNTASFNFRKSAGTEKLQADFRNVTFFVGEKVIYGTLLNGKPKVEKLPPDPDVLGDDNIELTYKYKLSAPADAMSFDFAILKKVEPRNLKILSRNSSKQDPTEFFNSIVQTEWRPDSPGVQGSVSKYSFKSKADFLVIEGWRNDDGSYSGKKDLFSFPLNSCKFTKSADLATASCVGEQKSEFPPADFNFLVSNRKLVAFYRGTTIFDLRSTFELDGIQYVFFVLRSGPIVPQIFGIKNGTWSEHIKFLMGYYP